MNVHANPTLTTAEKALVDTFAERFSTFPGDPNVAHSRDNAIEQIKAGLPTRRVESWHYTDLRRLLSSVPAFDHAAQPNEAEVLLPGSSVLRVINGVADSSPAVDGISVARLHDLLLAGDQRTALVPADADDAVGAINSAFASDGYSLDIPAGVELAAPVEFQNLQAGGQVHARFAVTAGEGAKATIVERQTGSGAALASSVTTLSVAAGSEVTYIILQDQPSDATHLGQINVTIGIGIFDET